MRRRLSIAIPIHSFEPGGVEKVALNLAAEWRDEGHRVSIILGRPDGAMRKDAPNLDYRCRPSSIPTAGFETIWMIICVLRYLRKHPVDILFCAGNTYAIVAFCAKLFAPRGCPPVVIKISNDLARRDFPWPVRAGYHLWLKVQGRAFDHFVGMAEPMRNEIATLMHAQQARISIIEDPAISHEQFERLRHMPVKSAGSWGSRLLAIGRLVPQKNFALLIRAFATYAWSHDRLTIVGDGPERDMLFNLARKLGVGDRVEFAGHRTDIASYLQRNDIFVLSSDYEGVPAVIIEALAAGLPVVATDCSVSMPALLGHGEFGLLVPVRDIDALGAALNNARNFPGNRTAAREFAKRFTLCRAARSYQTVMEQMLTVRHSVPA